MAQDQGGKIPAGKGGRDARLKAALRENLRRRKAQARGRGEKQASEPPAREPEAGPRR